MVHNLTSIFTHSAYFVLDLSTSSPITILCIMVDLGHKLSSRVILVKLHVTNHDSIKKAATEVDSKFGAET